MDVFQKGEKHFFFAHFRGSKIVKLYDDELIDVFTEIISNKLINS